MVAVALGGAFFVAALEAGLVAAPFVVDAFAADVEASFAAASAREVLLSAARALPAAVCAPFALPALPAAMRCFAAFWAAAFPTVQPGWAYLAMSSNGQEIAAVGGDRAQLIRWRGTTQVQLTAPGTRCR